ncbi:chromosomal replication initiator protein DnaA [Patescibacteria group bacterium]|nr:chromosomal replication initiator protein DnaA [Patescibacteria group bacterium]MBU1519188.1 chromosomal replication initiator protein DnaA [Patescibacteria group bacterium]MBU1729947.1 chromosomal replication initiator protein DnaA [Patescibacteria group bacterium]MBU1956168.1 chromosomal replication initiator protein DnaA [Patescibacteria group bacterium]MBU2416708.1 chromosomal replication initiator protein DnaA [Patescibacteria group bacterium]
MLDNKTLWEDTLLEIELTVSRANFNTWFKNTHIIKQEAGTVVLGVPNPFVHEWLVKNYHNAIVKILRSFDKTIRALDYVIHKEPLVGSAHKTTKKPKGGVDSINTQLPLENLYVNKEDNLNPKYTFSSFVIGSFNELANAAAQAIIKKQGVIYNPLFVYGPTGLGKTHLIQAIGNHIKKTRPDKKVIYITSEKFAMDYITSLQTGKINKFKERYRNYDFFIMDDIQFLSNKERTQEELFHIFNTLYDNNKQIIFSSDKHPNHIPEIEERLKSRFSAGMTVDISEPDYDSKTAILRAKAEKLGFFIKEECINLIALLVQGNIRDIEGVLNSIIIQSQTKNKELSLNEIKTILKNTLKPKKSISIKDVIKIVSDFYNINESMFYEKTRRREIIKPRQVAMYLLREDFNISYPSIGEELGGRDHTTVIYACDKIKKSLQLDNLLGQEIEQLRTMF